MVVVVGKSNNNDDGGGEDKVTCSDKLALYVAISFSKLSFVNRICCS